MNSDNYNSEIRRTDINYNPETGSGIRYYRIVGTVDQSLGNIESLNPVLHEDDIIEESPDNDIIEESPDNSINIQESNTDTEFNLEFQVFLRQFKGQTSGPTIGNWSISCNSVEDFHDKVWERAKQHIKREIYFDEEMNPAFAEHDPEEEGGKFLIFNDKTAKISRNLTQICENTLKLWGKDTEQKREIHIYIHPYSIAVSGKKMWEKVNDRLISSQEKDRAGASSQKNLNEIVDQLKQKHSHEFKAAHIHWLQWANKIASSDAYLRDDMIEADPPSSIAKFFQPTDEPFLQKARDDVMMSRRLNSGSLEDIQSILEHFKGFKMETINKMTIIETNLERIVIKLQQNDENLTTFNDRLDNRPVENTDSIEYFNKIPRQDDTDHVIYEN
uniref:CSON013724 protein n=1 Tax=Culicoides sonorensis TaxID=179676 RepID=A0A336M8J7_CULSO